MKFGTIAPPAGETIKRPWPVRVFTFTPPPGRPDER
jgi:hypothetical protein